MKPFCFVLMPFGTKTDGNKKEINFDKVYESFIKPAILRAGLDPIRADEETSGGFIHKPMYERLLFCKFAVADLSFANANVFYELGIRHAVKPYTTVSIFESSTKLPFDTAPLRAIPYDFVDGAVANLEQKTKQLAELIKTNLNAQKTQNDSPIAQLITSYKFPELDYLQQDADAFTEWVNRTKAVKQELEELVRVWQKLEKSNDTAAQQEVLYKVRQLEANAGDGLRYDYDLLYSFLNTYKSISAFKEITALLKPVVDTTAKGNIYLRQQLALAYNKVKQREEAEKILTEIIEQYGPDPETNGLLGAVYKGLMDDHREDELMCREYRTQAIGAYLAGFEADPRDYYPGVNALTLMYFDGAPVERFHKFLPLVAYAVERQLQTKKKDYWVQATALELAALEMDEIKAKKQLSASLFCRPDKWMRKTTASNLEKIYNKSVQTNADPNLVWLSDAIQKLKEG